MTNVSEMAPCHIVTSRPEGTALYLQRGFILAQDGPVELGDQYLDESTRATPVRDLWAPAAQDRGWELLGDPRPTGLMSFTLTARRVA